MLNFNVEFDLGLKLDKLKFNIKFNIYNSTQIPHLNFHHQIGKINFFEKYVTQFINYCLHIQQQALEHSLRYRWLNNWLKSEKKFTP